MAIDSIARALSGQANKVATDAIAAAEEAIHTATEQIPSIVTDWLDDNVTPVGSAVVVDSSLSISGAAADAKATGDGLTDLKNALDATENDLFKLIGNIQGPWTQGGMYSATGIEYPSTSHIRTPFIKVNSGDTIYIENPDTTLQLSILEFASNTTTASGTNERLAITYAGSSVKSVALGNSTNYIRLQLPTGDTLKGDDILLYTKNNIVFNESVTMNGTLPNNTDANDLTTVGFFLINSTNTYYHLPVTVGVLANYKLSQTTSLQIVYGWNDEKVYKRTRVGSVWSEWLVVSGGVTMNGTLPNNTDANDLITVGFFLINSTYTYYHLPVATGFIANYKVSQNTSLQVVYSWSDEKIYKRRQLGSVWSEWLAVGGGVTNNYTFESYDATYNITATPSITTDTNAYLSPTGDTTDRTSDIVTMLTNQGVCRLGKGDYYVSNLQMPAGTMIKGTGTNTRIILSGSSAGFAIKMSSYCTVSDCLIMGKTSSITLSDILDPESTVPLRHGILWQGTYTQDQSTANQPINGMVSNVRFLYFTGGAITCYDTGYGTFNALEVSNIFCMNCNVGVNVSYWSEYHKFTNVRTASCYYGCINNGGNNVFTNCDFSTCKVGFLMDNSSDQSPNNSHGSCVACVFNHIDNNTGIGIKILNCDAGFIFDGCQIFYSQTYIEDSDGVVFANCNYGGSSGTQITITNGGLVMYEGCCFKNAPTVTKTGNTATKMLNCYLKDGTAVTIS